MEGRGPLFFLFSQTAQPLVSFPCVTILIFNIKSELDTRYWRVIRKRPSDLEILFIHPLVLKHVYFFFIETILAEIEVFEKLRESNILIQEGFKVSGSY
jgi:hypothetical protein